MEVTDARIGWRLAPLLKRRVQLGEVHAASVEIERRGPPPAQPAQPLEPLQSIQLPIEVDLPFQVDRLRWAGPPPLEATGLSGHYRYAGAHHQLEIGGVDIADGHYSAQVDLQGAAPMAIDARLHGRVKAPLAEDRSIEVLADATVQGTLSGADARLAVAAHLKPADANTGAGAEHPMQADLDAHLAPWQSQPVIDADATLQNLDLASLWPQAPTTRLSGSFEAGPEAAVAGAPQGWHLKTDLRNDEPGPWDKARLPIEQLQARAGFDGSTWTLPEATVRAGGGRIDAEGSWSPAPAPWKASLTLTNVQPGALLTDLAGAPVSGRLTAEQRGPALLFDLALQARGGAGAAGSIGLRLERALAQGQWQDGLLDLRSLRLEADGASLDGRLQANIAQQSGSGRLELVVPGGSAQVDGRIAPVTGDGTLQVRLDDTAALQRWIEGLPEVGAVFGGVGLQGSARLDAGWHGGWQAVQRRLQTINQPAARGAAEPTVQATLTVPKLELRLPAAPGATSAVGAIVLSGVRAELAGSLAQSTLSLKGEAAEGSRKFVLDTKASGGLERADQWHAALASLRLQASDSTLPDSGPWVLDLSQAVHATVRSVAGATPRLEVEASAASATLKGPAPGTVRIDWQPLKFSSSGSDARRAVRLQSKGRLQGLPMAWAEALGGADTLNRAGFSGDLLFDGDWDIDAGDTLRAHASLTRQSGDLRVQAGEAALVTRITSHGTGAASEITMNAAGPGASTPAGLHRAELKVDAEGNTVRANLAWDSERAGEIRVEASTQVQQRGGGWLWPEDAPITGHVTARMPNLGVWSILAPPGWRVGGTLQADATLSGNRAEPRWNGSLGADQLAVRALVDGLDLRNGRLRATLEGTRVALDEFSLEGGVGGQARIPGQGGNLSTSASEAAKGGGTLTAKGELGWGPAPAPGSSASGIRMSIQAQLNALRVLVRSDRQLTLSGQLQAGLDNGQFSVHGKLVTDRAVIILPDDTAPSLGSDVIVRSAALDRERAEAAARNAEAARSEQARAHTAKPPDIAVQFDLGRDFAVQGRGVTTRLEGQLDIRGTSLEGPPRITGEVRTVSGQYRAYGQQLTIETGVARFNGPFDNPQLDILAIRPNISQRAGVAITGTAQSPRVRLYSEPQLSDQETLSWLVLGRASASGGGESVLLQQAALALLGNLGQGGTGGGLASRFGLDEIGFKGPGSGGDVRDSSLTVGKRLAQDFYITYERSLGNTLGSLFIFYDLTRRLTLRAQAGQTSAIDLIYTVQFD